MATITYEAMTVQTTQATGAAERLSTEQTILLNKIQQEGFELGIRSSSKLTYKDFQHFERVYPLAASLDEDVLEYLWAFLSSHGYSEEGRSADSDFAHLLDISPQSHILFAQSWIDGVLSVWNTLQTQ